MFGVTTPYSLAIGEKEREMDLASAATQTEIGTKENGRMKLGMARAPYTTKMVASMKETSRAINSMDLESFTGLMELLKKVNGKTIRFLNDEV